MNAREVQRLQWDQPVRNGIVQLALNAHTIIMVVLQIRASKDEPVLSKHYFTRRLEVPATTSYLGRSNDASFAN